MKLLYNLLDCLPTSNTSFADGRTKFLDDGDFGMINGLRQQHNTMLVLRMNFDVRRRILAILFCLVESHDTTVFSSTPSTDRLVATCAHLHSFFPGCPSFAGHNK